MERRSVRFENITNAPNGVDKLGLKRIVHLRTQAADNNIDDVRVSFESYVPHMFCNLSARYHFAGRANQMREKEKFLRREIERNTGARCLVVSHVNFQISYADMFCLSLRS